MAGRQWEGSTHGNGWMHRNLIRLLRWIHPVVLYVFVDIFVIPWSLLIYPSRRYAYRFYRHALGYGVARACWATYRNHCYFAQVVIDRFAMYAGRRFKTEVVGIELFNELAAREEGFVQLSSHIGNYEIAGYSLPSLQKSICALVFSGEKATVMQNRDHMFEQTHVQMIAIRPDMGHLFEIDAALCRGDIVSFPADRYQEGTKVLTLPFFGKEAKFPQGPFRTATMRGVDVLAVSVMKQHPGKYQVYVTPLPYDRALPRQEQLMQLASGYVAELEKRVRQYPLQWYNFFDFWA